MKILVLSDSHGRSDLLSRAVELCGEADALLHLGDGYRDVKYSGFPEEKCFLVRGNGEDWGILAGNDVPRERLLDFEGVKVLMLHGHKPYNVKYSADLERMIAYASDKGADILIFGHTHSTFNKTYTRGTLICGKPLAKNITVFNPGSIGEPRFSSGSFGVITIRNGVPLLSHGEIEC